MLGNSSTLRREYELLEQLTDSIVVVNAVGNILLVNKPALKRWRYQSEQLLGESIFQLLDESESRISLPLSQVVGKIVDVKLRQGNGEYRKVVMSVSKLQCEQQTLYLLIVKYSYPLALPRSTVSPQYCKLLSFRPANANSQEQTGLQPAICHWLTTYARPLHNNSYSFTFSRKLTLMRAVSVV
ncbi:MAG: PAS domain-containing protein [Shewanella fodinae]|nr:PAS domain-containing protein [Shewanella fodinae]